MCGIAGFSGSFPPALLRGMNGTIAHRGPDDEGLWHDPAEGIGLAHRRLSIIDLSPAGHQPMWDASRRAAIVFNGEIYNYRELRAPLEAEGFRFLGHSDTEVLLNLYLRHGEAMLGMLNGIFAFAIWDPARRSLLIARDGLGVKPLYWHRGPRGFLFASEMKALLECPDVAREIDPEAVRYHMSYLWCPAPRTMIKGISKLEPGYALIVREGRVETRKCFYDLPYSGPFARIGAREAAERVAAAVELAVERQMVADVPVGAFLSGGLDSSSIAAFARSRARGRLQCFTIGFDAAAARREDFGLDEGYARRVAAHLDVDLHTVRVGPGMADRLGEMLWHLDEPQADPAPLNALLICGLARERGIKVLLSGAGGDDIFTGYRRHWALAQERWWAWLPHGARRALAAAAARLPQGSPPGRRAAKALRYAGLDADARLASYFLWTDPDAGERLYGPAVPRAAHPASAALAPLLATLGRLPAGTDPLQRMLYLEGKHFLADHNLNYTDRMSMAMGVEVRVPLLDPDLVALAATLPPGLKQKGRIGKWIFKKAMEPHLPHDVIYRPKVGFGVPLRHWMRNELRPLVDEMLSASSLRDRGLFDPGAVKALQAADARGAADGGYTLFAVLCMEMWCRMFIDGSPGAARPAWSPEPALKGLTQ